MFTKSNASISNNPLSVNFNFGITGKDKNDKVRKGLNAFDFVNIEV